MRRHLESELEYKIIIKNDEYDVTTLYNLIRKVCSGLISVVIEDVVESILEALYNFLLNRGDDYDSLLKYMEASNYKFKVLKAARFTFATPEI